MKKKGFITGLLFAVVLFAALSSRIYYILYIMDKVNVNEGLLDSAVLGGQGIVIADIFSGGITVKALYILCLSVSCMFFGNFAVTGVYLNVAFQVIAVMLLFIIGKNVLNRYLGFALGIMAAVLPYYVNRLSDVNQINLEITLWAMLFCITSIVIRSLISAFYKKNDAQASMPEIAAEEYVQPLVEPVIRKDTSMKEIVLDDIEDKKPKFIENPLPVPKRRAHKEMDFAVGVEENDDYDIKDMVGMDFFDIE